jgi:hypothetical protein
MITLEKLKVYRMFSGDIDGFARTYRGEHPSGITDADWSHIDSFCQALSLVSAGRATDEFAASVEQKLVATTDSEQTRQELRELSAWSDRQHPERFLSSEKIYWVHSFEL